MSLIAVNLWRSFTDYYGFLATALHLHASHGIEYADFAQYHAATDRWNDFATIGGQTGSSANRLHYCLASQLLQGCVIPPMVRPATRPSPPRLPPLSPHTSTQNLFVCYMNITSVLATPGLPHPRDLVLDAPVASPFRSGFEAEGDKSGKVAAMDAGDWRRGQMFSRFMRLANQDALQDYHHLEALNLLVTPDEDEKEDRASLAAALVTRATTGNTRALADGLAACDEPESAVRQRETRYFDVAGAQRRVLALKVALAAEMNQRFVADARLWRWVAAVPDGRLWRRC
ncbi:hypothetical protein B0H67DRAFT_599170 [Lasiosphaeris hirsuta]|uniref:Uncharacterized protein n=1 Tax=Lasiosphaeris hirsuta TaxID=260670 RepID=A0AA40E1N2_9PEZI|nr:hypothetical protein B0H67DRAFT_599170 [Lasiosphaeris hirsuta]